MNQECESSYNDPPRRKRPAADRQTVGCPRRDEAGVSFWGYIYLGGCFGQRDFLVWAVGFAWPDDIHVMEDHVDDP